MQYEGISQVSNLFYFLSTTIMANLDQGTIVKLLYNKGFHQQFLFEKMMYGAVRDKVFTF